MLVCPLYRCFKNIYSALQLLGNYYCLPTQLHPLGGGYYTARKQAPHLSDQCNGQL